MKYLARENWRAALILLAVLHICFFPCIWGNRTLLAASEDAPSIMPTGAWAGKPVYVRFPKNLDEGGPGFMTEPLLKLVSHQYLKEHTLPLWNPYQGYGVPLAADMQSQPFYPLSAVVSFYLTPRTYNWYILFRLFIGGMCMYLYLRYFVSFLPALAGGITSMLSGYYVLFITMPQLSVEILLPAGLLATEYLLKRRGFRAVVWFAIFIFLVLVGGMPESSAVLLGFVYLYQLFRVVADVELRLRWKQAAGYWGAATVAGFGLSALLLLPFREFMVHSFDLHQAVYLNHVIMGVQHDTLDHSIFTYWFPLLFGPSYLFKRNYFGLIGTVLIFTAVAGLFRKEERRANEIGRLTGYFAFFLLATVLKRYGFPLVNVFGYLPFYNLVWFPKYEEVVVSACASALFAIGLERFVRLQVSAREQVSVLTAAFLLIPLALSFSWRALVKAVSVDGVKPTIPLTSIAVPACGLFCLALVLILYKSESLHQIRNKRLTIALISLLSAEFILNFIGPVYYFFNRIPRQSHDPYAGAPFVRFLQKQIQNNERIMGREGVLFPNWSSTFQLTDIRNLDAMYYKKYLPFVKNFIANQIPNPEDLYDRFNGTGDYDLRTPMGQRLLQLSSVRYIVGTSAFYVPNAMIEDILSQNLPLLRAGASSQVRRNDLVLAGVAREGLGEHPPYSRFPYRLAVGNHRLFHFSYALDPAVFDKTSTDGVGFMLEVKDASGAISKLFYRYIDPKHNPGERRWMDSEIDLSRYRGQNIQLLFSTDAGPHGNSAYDWAAWSNFHFDDEQDLQVQPFKPVYDAEARVYQCDRIVPRAAIYYSADLQSGEKKVLHRLADPSLDVFQTVVLDSSNLSTEQQTFLTTLQTGQTKQVEAAKITSYQSQSVTIESRSNQPGILVLNDSDYPGWTVTIDGHPGEWLTANYLFRGVLLTPGVHTVQFRYRPASVFYGAAISSATAFGLLAVAFLRRWRFRSGPNTRYNHRHVAAH